jgi:hypothetical protein
MTADTVMFCLAPRADSEMGLAPGGRMRQEVYSDPFAFDEWDLDSRSRCFAHIVNSTTWGAITATLPPTEPPTAADYSREGLPWFEYYDADAVALAGAESLKKLKSVAEYAKQKGDAGVGYGGGVTDLQTVLISRNAGNPWVREGSF